MGDQFGAQCSAAIRARDLSAFGFNGSVREPCYIPWVRDHREVARRDFDDDRTHPLGEEALNVGWYGLIVSGDHVPRRQRLPGWNTHDLVECGCGQRLLSGVKDSRLYRIDVSREMVYKIVL